MLFSVIPKRTLAFSPQNQPLRLPNPIAGTEYDLKAIYKKCIRERVRLGPSTGSIVEEAVSRNIPWIRLGTNSLVQLGHGIKCVFRLQLPARPAV
jgi:cyanophycin synthetase